MSILPILSCTIDKRGAADAERHVAKQMQRNRARFDVPLDDMPVYSCISSTGDDGLDELFTRVERFRPSDPNAGSNRPNQREPRLHHRCPTKRVRYLRNQR